MTNNPLVSIIIPAYNCEKFIASAINSCLNQTYQNIEIIVVNDGSTDNTLQIIQDIAAGNHRVHVYSQFNQGACTARNRGINEAKGEFVKFLDGDDVLVLDAIEFQVETSRNLSDNDIVYGWMETVDEQLNHIENNKYPKNEENKNLFSYWFWDIGTSTPLFRRELLLKIKGFDNGLPFGQESDLIVRTAVLGGNFVFIDKCIYLQIQHNSPTRLRNSANYTEYWVFLRQIKKIIALLKQQGKYNQAEETAILEYFAWKIKLYYELGMYENAKQALIEMDKIGKNSSVFSVRLKLKLPVKLIRLLKKVKRKVKSR